MPKKDEDQKTRRKSQVWCHFRKQSKTHAVCGHCNAVLSSCGNTTNLMSHLKRKHKIELGEGTGPGTRRMVQGVDAQGNAFLASELDLVHILKSESNRLDTPDNSQENGTVQFVFQQEGYDSEGFKDNRILNSIIYMVCRDHHPLYHVEGEGFQRLMKELAPFYSIPNRETIVQSVDVKYAELASKKMSILEGLSHLSLAVDLWTEVDSGRNFMEVMVHYVNDDSSDYQSLCIGVKQLDTNRTTEAMQTAFNQVLQFWKIPREKFAACITDEEPSLVRATQEYFGYEKHLYCYANMLQGFIHQVNFWPSFTILKEKIRNIVFFFEQNTAASDELTQEQWNRNPELEKTLKLKQENVSLWNSCYEMLERYVALHECTTAVLRMLQGSPPQITPLELQNIKEMIAILKPFMEIASEIATEKYTPASKLIPLGSMLKQELGEITPRTVGAAEIHRKLFQDVENYLSRMEENEIVAIATVLDPRFRNYHFSRDTNVNKTLSTIDGMMNCNRPPAIEAGPSTSSEPQSGIWKHHKKLLSSVQMGLQQPDGSLSSELKQYLSMGLLDLKESPLVFWSKYNTLFPNLSKIAEKYLCIIASSVPAGRLFSKSGIIIAEKRRNIRSDRIEKLLFLSTIPYEDW